MTKEHWFDALSKALVRTVPRRAVLHASGPLTAGLGFLALPSPGAAKKKGKKGRGKGKGKGKKDEQKKDPWGCKDRFKNLRIKDPNCSGEGVCKSFWPDDPCEEKYCEFICYHCDGDDPSDFCIIDGDSPVKRRAVCCEQGKTCCLGDCRNTDNDSYFCGPDCTLCGLGQSCVGGQCVNNDCPAGLTRCGGACVDTKWNQTHCGGCYAANPDNLFCCNGALCPHGMPCHNGVCTCGTYNYCHHRDLGWVCFSDDCSLIE
jgi:hypothetical protein